MKTKKILASALIIGTISMNYTPVLANSFMKKTVIQTQVTEYKFNDVNLNWWKSYNDEYLEGYIVKALDNNYDLKIANLKIEEAKQNVKLQFSKELPTASVGFAPFLTKMQNVRSTEGMLAFPINVSYEADIFLKNHDKTKSVKKLHEIAKINEKGACISIASAVGANYFNIIKLDKLISIQNEIISSRKEIYELMKIRNNEGITSTADLIRAEKSFVSAQAELCDLEKTRNALLNNLAVLIGESPENASELKRSSYDELKAKLPVPNEISSDIIVKRPDYLIAEKQVEKAGLDVKIAKKEFLPSVDILGLMMFSMTSASNSLNWANALMAFGGSTMLPIFTGGGKFANLRLYKNKYEQILQTYYKTNLIAIQEVNDALCAAKLDDEKLTKNIKTLNMEKEDFKYTQQRYNQGIISHLDVLQKQESLLVMNKMVSANKIDCYIDQISLYKATGGQL